MSRLDDAPTREPGLRRTSKRRLLFAAEIAKEVAESASTSSSIATGTLATIDQLGAIADDLRRVAVDGTDSHGGSSTAPNEPGPVAAGAADVAADLAHTA